MKTIIVTSQNNHTRIAIILHLHNIHYVVYYTGRHLFILINAHLNGDSTSKGKSFLASSSTREKGGHAKPLD